MKDRLPSAEQPGGLRDRAREKGRFRLSAVIALIAFIVIVGAVFLYVFLTAKGRRARILLGKAKIALKRSRFAEAEGLLHRAAEIRAGDGGIRFHLGRALEAQGKMKEAREEYGKALEFAPDLFEATVRFASVCMALKDFDAAERALDAAEERGKKRKAFPHDAQIRFLRGQVLLAQRHGERAEGEFREAIALNRRLLPPRFALVRCLIARRDIKEAEKQLKAIIEVSPMGKVFTSSVVLIR